MQHLEGSGTLVLYMGRKVLKDQLCRLRHERSGKLWQLQLQICKQHSAFSLQGYSNSISVYTFTCLPPVVQYLSSLNLNIRYFSHGCHVVTYVRPKKKKLCAQYYWRSCLPCSCVNTSFLLNPQVTNVIYIYMERLFLMFLDHTQRRSTVGRTPLDE